MIKHPSSVLITGASSGIGEALAMLYAGKTGNLASNGRDTKSSRWWSWRATIRERLSKLGRLM